MQLKKTFITRKVADMQIMVPVGESAQVFSGFVKSNKTAAYIVELFRNDITEEQAVEKVLEKYEVDRETALRDVRMVIENLQSIHAFEEERK